MIITSADYKAIMEQSVGDRYLIPEQIEELLFGISEECSVVEIGRSVENRKIEAATFGSGPKKILMWSQMHGNESTTTKACLDLINLFNSKNGIIKALLNNCTIMVIPMLNPDGAIRYTRMNANNVDLNRDAQNRTQPESKILKQAYEHFSPDFCFNLHDQRTIYNVGDTDMSATVSFLAPSHDEVRSISETRSVAMRLIVAMNKALQTMIPGQVARYDDAFNANCVGDAFQMLNTPTVLFEAGHFAEDYQRERTREYIFQALLTAVRVIARDEIQGYDQKEYFKIPENDKRFYDILIKNFEFIKPDLAKNTDIGILYREELQGNKIHFIPEIIPIEKNKKYYGHLVYNCLDKRSLSELKKQFYWDTLVS